MKTLLLQVAVLAFVQVSTINSAILTCKSDTLPCNPTSLTPLQSSKDEISVAGKPSSFIDNSTTSLSLTQPNTLNFIPSYVFTIFPNLNSVTFTNVSITSVTTDSFTNCGKLISIYLNFNNFPTLPSAFASTCINVTSLYLMTNYIKELDNDALKGLTFLNYFYAAQNNITCIPPGLFTHTPVVQFIDLSYNQISEIDSSTFKGLANLNNINLMYNKIVNLPAFDVTNTGLTMSFMLMLGDNPIKSVSPKFITNIFTTRGGSPMSANVMLYNSQNLTTTCFPSTQYFYGTIFSSNWPTANISLGLCYSNWKAEYETTPVSCRGNAPVETTTSKNENGNGSVGGKWPFGDKNFFAIITNAMKNFTANVSFY